MNLLKIIKKKDLVLIKTRYSMSLEIYDLNRRKKYLNINIFHSIDNFYVCVCLIHMFIGFLKLLFVHTPWFRQPVLSVMYGHG